MYRSRVSSFNHAQLLTHGNPIGFSAIATRLNDPAGSVDAVCTGSEPMLIGQAQHSLGERSARLNYITPTPFEDHPGLSALLDFICIRAGELGAANLLAEVRESGGMIETFRRNGFSICGWETIWRFPMANGGGNGSDESLPWKRMLPKEESAARALYTSLVPPILQSVEPFQSDPANTLVYKGNGEIQAMVEVRSGSKGVFLIPVIHPSLEDPRAMLNGLARCFGSYDRPVYLQMRSFQAWLTTFLEEMEAETSAHFALMSHRLAIPQFVTEEQPDLVVKHRRVQTTSPIVQRTSRSGQ